MGIRYYDSDNEVQLGDHVKTRFWFFFKKTGRVVYVPGVSPFHSDYEHHGLKWVGIFANDESLFGSVVDPKTGTLLERVKFLKRDTSDLQVLIKKIPPDRPRPSDEE